MQADTRLFGKIDIEDEKIIKMDQGIVGFPDLKHFALIHDIEGDDDGSSISWLQSMEEPAFAMPVMDPLLVKPDYNPMFSDEYLSALGDVSAENGLILVTVTVPTDLKEMSVNLRAPFVINTDNMQAAQIIVEDDLPVRFKIYDILNEKAGE